MWINVTLELLYFLRNLWEFEDMDLKKKEKKERRVGIFLYE